MNSNENNTFGIVVPCYNSIKTMDRTIESLISLQSCDGITFQIILVDDGSTDGTSERCDWYMHHYNNIIAVHKPNGGLVDAWKAGVTRADTEYIMFCDADDYIASDFIKRIGDITRKYNPDIIAFGMTIEYDNGKSATKDVRAKEGFYSSEHIKDDVLPNLFSDGTMESLLLMGSRCNKVFRRDLLLKVMPDIPERVSMGEDDITCFLSALNCISLYVVRDYYPYHYVRNVSSMIGSYDDNVFDRIDLLYKEINDIAKKYNYSFIEQINRDYFSTLILYMKKEISKSPNGFMRTREKLDSVHEKNAFEEGIRAKYYQKYSGFSKIFCKMMIYRFYYPAYLGVRMIEVFRGVNV